MTLKQQVAKYWNENMHDQKIAMSPVGSKKFFDNVYAYHFKKQAYLLNVIDYKPYKNKSILGIGCGSAMDLLKFAEHGAKITGIDLSKKQIEFAKENFAVNKKKGSFMVMDAEHMMFSHNSFDVVFAHGILQYTPVPKKVVEEAHSVLKPGGKLLVAVYHRHSWLSLISAITRTPLEHQHAPVFRTFSFSEVRALLKPFSNVILFCERFPVKTKLHHGFKAQLYNNIFIPFFNTLPRPLISKIGWHIVGEATK